MKRAQLLVIICIHSCCSLLAQVNQGLHPPLDTPIYLSATFGSLRDNHFHSGMDLRTNEIEGLPVYAIEDGYVSRIKIQSVGYGKALYITHPTGITSVYGHLSDYATDLRNYIHQYQYSNQSFEIDHFPQKDRLRVKKGDIIGYSGNTGTSSGPHLHFEIRDSRSEAINNPLAFRIPVNDTIPPEITRVVLYDLAGQRPRISWTLPLSRSHIINTDSGYWSIDSLPVPASMFGIGVIASDKMILPEKEYSIYSLQLNANSKQLFRFQMDQFTFDRTRCVNTHIDYQEYVKSGDRIQKLFLDDGNSISLYPFTRNKGKLHTRPAYFRITVSDYAGHFVHYYIPVKPAPTTAPLIRETCSGTWAFPSTETNIQSAGCHIRIPPGSLFDTALICTEQISIRNASYPILRIADTDIPLYRSFHISLPLPESVPPSLSDKLCMTWQPKENASPRFISTYSGGGLLKGKSLQFGFFSMKLDTTAPEIIGQPDIANRLLADSGSLTFKVTDDFSGLSNYSATLNGEWILLEYDAKSNVMIYSFDEVIHRHQALGKRMILIVSATDKCGNTKQVQFENPNE